MAAKNQARKRSPKPVTDRQLARIRDAQRELLELTRFLMESALDFYNEDVLPEGDWEMMDDIAADSQELRIRYDQRLFAPARELDFRLVGANPEDVHAMARLAMDWYCSLAEKHSRASVPSYVSPFDDEPPTEEDQRDDAGGAAVQRTSTSEDGLDFVW